MKFDKFLNETDISISTWENHLKPTLEAECQPYIKQLRGCKHILARGVSTPPKDWLELNVRTDRQPRYIDKTLHSLMDYYTGQKWKFKSRSQGLFCVSSGNVGKFGKPVVIFPIGNFKYAWNKNVSDLYDVYDTFDWKWRVERSNALYDDGDNITEIQAKQEVFKKTVVHELEQYIINKDLNKYLRMDFDVYDFNECIIHCKKYYAINWAWVDVLKGWFTDRYWR